MPIESVIFLAKVIVFDIASVIPIESAIVLNIPLDFTTVSEIPTDSLFVLEKDDDDYCLITSVYDPEGRLIGTETEAVKTAELFALSTIGADSIAGILGIDESRVNLSNVYSSDPEANRLFFKGEELYEKDKTLDARNYFIEALAKDNSFALCHYYLAQTWEQAGYSNRSIESLAGAMINQDRLPIIERLNVQIELAYQLGFHEKPCGLLNIEGYYDDLIGFLENSFEQKFVKELYRPLLMKADKPAVLLDQFSGYKAPKVRKWMDEDEL